MHCRHGNDAELANTLLHGGTRGVRGACVAEVMRGLPLMENPYRITTTTALADQLRALDLDKVLKP